MEALLRSCLHSCTPPAAEYLAGGFISGADSTLKYQDFLALLTILQLCRDSIHPATQEAMLQFQADGML